MVNKQLRRAAALCEISRWHQAVHELNNLLASESSNYEALCYVSWCYLELHEFNPALKFAKRAAESNPLQAWTYRLQTIIYRVSGDHHKALEAAEMCLRQSPFSLLSIQNLAYSQINLFRLEEAQKTVDNLIRRFPAESLSHDACGYLSLKKEDWKNAEAHLQRALQIEPTSAITLNNLGNVYILDFGRKEIFEKQNHQV